MSYKISEIEGIGPVYTEKLGQVGITTTDHLLTLCASAKGRADISEKSGLSTSQLLTWADMADMMRLNGIGPQFSELLKAAGVDTVKELRTRNAENLTAKLAEINAEKKLARSVPALSLVTGWIDQAKGTEPLISH
jgi:predicted flap endonuclease-1-like 5' DNA nuclease